MLYLNADNITALGLNWDKLTDVIHGAVHVLEQEDYSQPIKPYLRYGDLKNRIIAMPAYIGGDHPMAGIKWIASFPDNIYKNKLRANSVTILNEHDSGVPISMINTSAISAIRTAAVSGLMIREWKKKNGAKKNLKVGINGFGPIGRMHLSMVSSIVGDQLGDVYLHDIGTIDETFIGGEIRSKVKMAASWEECYTDADIFITCTVSAAPYIDKAPAKGSLQLNVSLRDYKAEMKDFMDVIVVDDWEEVCRQNTDIEKMHQEKGLMKEDTFSIADLICKDPLKDYTDPVVMFNPMGMAIFDIAVGGYYYREALSKNIGTVLPD
ncbi:MAG TPA: hypothetical protein VM802_14355 [Chitinophaga sp.]|uniref:2,3-diaminopropionate biosynthesis protein SbnB n=1 Tax=Chitinophaga sp. TaxID=1869181 RepID=UPI002C8F6321|nr:2,3-diaminopropionate biosynthesis protein SbnB [Chitinophaga sp.]HVI46054.1 hypothetical protein [Chitinophaga sp.]